MAALATALLALAASARAQFGSGDLYGTVTGKAAGPLAGARVTLAIPRGETAPAEDPARSRTTDGAGQFRFLGLEPGSYQLRVEAAGYAAAVHKAVAILVGRATAVQVQLSPVPSETITVTADPPLLDRTALTPRLVVRRAELETIPTSRDPWAIAAQAPGVLLTGFNAGGSEGGHQQPLAGPGASISQSAFAVDGVVVTDPTVPGGASLYFDFDQFEEVAVDAGGLDASVATPGVTLNMVTRRGSNQARGSARYLATSGGWESRPDRAPALAAPVAGSRVRRLDEYGAEGGGPLSVDRLWLWGAAGTADIHRRAAGGVPYDIRLGHRAAKLNWDLGGGAAGVALWDRAEKRAEGRGAGPDRAPETLWSQRGPTVIRKLEQSFLLAPEAQLTGFAASVDGEFGLEPRAGREGEIIFGADGVWRGGFAATRTRSTSREGRLEGAFLLGSHDRHEVGIGAGLRRFASDYREQWGPRDLLHVVDELAPPYSDWVEAMRPLRSRLELEYRGLWLQDRLRIGDGTLSLGLRYDGQSGAIGAIEVPANPAFPELLPAISYPGEAAPFAWESLAPRLGWSQSLGGRLLLRAAYARFAAQLGGWPIDRIAPLTAWVDLAFADADGDHLYDPGEPWQLMAAYGVDPARPGDALSPHRTAADLRPETTDELRLGLQRQLGTAWVATADLVARRVDDVLETRPLVRDASGTIRAATRDDYVAAGRLSGSLPDGTPYAAPVYRLAPGLAATGGRLLINGDREQRYAGATLGLERRLDAGWLLRGHLTWSDWRWRIGRDFRRHDDPTDHALGAAGEGPSDATDSAGEIVAEQTSLGDRNGFFLNSSWSYSLVGLRTFAADRPWGFTLAATASGRQGYPLPYAVRTFSGDGIVRWVQVTDRGDSYRHDDLHVLDLRLEKELPLRRLQAVVGLDCFNALDSDAVLQRNRQVAGPQPGAVRERLSPRVVRLGVRLRWR